MLIFLAGKGSWWNELICTGLFAVGLGIFLIILNCVISNREEQDLESYVQRQLTRSRSGEYTQTSIPDLWGVGFYSHERL